MPVDYSKWDRIDYGSSDDDEDEQGQQPRVTRLDTPSKVKVTPNGTIEINPSSATTKTANVVETKTTNRKTTGEGRMSSTTTTKTSIATTTTKREKDPWTVRGGAHYFDVVSRAPEDVNLDDVNPKLYWSQDRYSVVVRIEVPKEYSDHVKGIRVLVKGQVFRYRDRTTAVGSMLKSENNDDKNATVLAVEHSFSGDTAKVAATTKNRSTHILKGSLAYAIHWPEDRDDDSDETFNWSQQQHAIDWTVDYRDGKKFITFELFKASPMEGVVVWWNHLLQGMDEVEHISEGICTNQESEFSKAWKEAHQQFQRKIATGEIPRRKQQEES